MRSWSIYILISFLCKIFLYAFIVCIKSNQLTENMATTVSSMQFSLLSPFQYCEGALSALEMKGACLEKNWPFTISKAQALRVFFSIWENGVVFVTVKRGKCWKCPANNRRQRFLAKTLWLARPMGSRIKQPSLDSESRQFMFQFPSLIRFDRSMTRPLAWEESV